MKSHSYSNPMAIGFVILLSITIQFSFAQQSFSGKNTDVTLFRAIPDVPEYSIFEIDVRSISDYVHGKMDNVPVSFNVGDIRITGTLIAKRSRKPGLISYRTNEYGEKEVLNRPEIIFRGNTYGDNPINFIFAINETLFAGAFSHDGKDYIVEPLWWHIEGTSPEFVILYESSVVEFLEEHQCGVDHTHYIEHLIEDVREDSEIDFRVDYNCKTVEYGSALDWSFVNKYGGEAGAWDRVDFVMGLVEFQYTGHFNWDFEYIRTAEYASECSTCDPWSSSTNSSTVLSSFRSWGNSGGFGNQYYDVAGLWTNRTFSGGVIGIAYVGGMCNSYRYHALRDWTTTSWGMRVMVAHELGHNFNYGHDSGTGWIMSPSVNNTTQWSNSSKNTINNFVGGNGASCLDNCIPPPPVADFSSSGTGGCLPVTIDFYDESEGIVSSWLWSFPGGEPSSSTLQNPTVTYSEKGTYNVSLTVTNAGGSDQKTMTGYVEINDIPVTYFDHESDELNAYFYNLSDGGVFFQWEFGDGAESTEANPEHIYPYDGTYLVTLNSSNECGETSFFKWIDIISLPVPEFFSNVTQGCAELTVEFQEYCSPNTTSWVWSFPGGIPETSYFENPTVVYSEPGVYEVTLVATNSLGDATITKTDYITVYEYPAYGFVYDISVDSVFFTSLGTADSLYWEFGDGNTSDEANPIHVYEEEGSYTVTLTTFTECGDSTFTKELAIIFPPIAEFSAIDSIVCGAVDIQFEDGSSESTTAWLWTFEGGAPAESDMQNPVVFYEEPGIYTVSLTVTNPAGEATLVKYGYIEVIAEPIAGFEFETEVNTVSFTNTSDHGTICEWDFGDGNSSEECNPVYSFSEEGIYTVTLTSSNECGTSTYSSDIVIVFPPFAEFTASITNGCAPLLVHFEDESSSSAMAWQWTFEGGNPSVSSEQNPEVEYNEPGIYPVSLTITNPLGEATESKESFIEIFPVPEADFDSNINGNEVVFINSSSNADEYSWDFGDGNSSNAENPIHNYESSGTYSVTLIATNECGSGTSMTDIEIKTTGYWLPEFLDAFELYPNPNTGTFTIQMKGQPAGSVDLEITDLLGRIIYAGNIDFNQAEIMHRIELSDVISGVYMLRLQHKGQTFSRPVKISQNGQ